MKVLLIRDIKSLGKKGEIKDVSDGYAKNFLIPKNATVLATEKVIKFYRQQQEILQKRKSKAKQNNKKLAKRLAGQTFEIYAKADVSGTLFGSVSKEQISEVLKNAGLRIEPESIILPQPIKRLGEHRVVVDLGENASQDITLLVTSAEQS